MNLIKVNLRAVGLLASERWLAISLVCANIAIGLVQLAEPILFGRVVDALSQGGAVFSLIALWAAIGLFGIVSGVIVAVAADRLAHRQRLAAMSRAFERTLTLPISYLAERGTGATVRTIVAGTDEFFRHWDEKGRQRTVVTAKAGETIEMIGKRHGVSAASMERINRRGRSEVLAEGERVVVWSAGKSAPANGLSTEPGDSPTLAKTAPAPEPTPALGTPPAPDQLPPLP